MTAVLTNNDLLRFRVEGGTLNPELAMAFPLDASLQGTLVRRMAKLGLSSLKENILSPLPIKPSSPHRQLESEK